MKTTDLRTLPPQKEPTFTDDFKKKNSLLLGKKKMFNEFFYFNFFFLGWGLRPPAPPTGIAPLDPVCFWIEDSSRNRFALNSISPKKLFFFLLKVKTFFS